MGALEKYGFAPDPVTEYLKKDVDRTLLREHLKLTPQQRLEKLVGFMRSLDHLRAARRTGREARSRTPSPETPPQ
jgi:hypothetical protein